MGKAIKVGLLLFAVSIVTGCSTQSATTVETEKTVQYAADKNQRRTEPTVVERQTTRTEEKTKSESESAGLLSGTVHVAGQVLALPFRLVGGLIGVVF